MREEYDVRGSAYVSFEVYCRATNTLISSMTTSIGRQIDKIFLFFSHILLSQDCFYRYADNFATLVITRHEDYRVIYY